MLSEEDKKKIQAREVKEIYKKVLVDKWYISNFYDKWDTYAVCFLLRSPDSKRKIVARLPQ